MRHYRFVDYATQLYLVAVGLLMVVLGGERVRLWPYLLCAHVAGMAAIHLLIVTHARRPRNRAVDLLRHWESSARDELTEQANDVALQGRRLADSLTEDQVRDLLAILADAGAARPSNDAEEQTPGETEDDGRGAL